MKWSAYTLVWGVAYEISRNRQAFPDELSQNVRENKQIEIKRQDRK